MGHHHNWIEFESTFPVWIRLVIWMTRFLSTYETTWIVVLDCLGITESLYCNLISRVFGYEERTSLPSTGFDSSICSFTFWTLFPFPVTAAMYCIINLEVSVFPEPDSPLSICKIVYKWSDTYVIMIHWFLPSESKEW